MHGDAMHILSVLLKNGSLIVKSSPHCKMQPHTDIDHFRFFNLNTSSNRFARKGFSYTQL